MNTVGWVMGNPVNFDRERKLLFRWGYDTVAVAPDDLNSQDVVNRLASTKLVIVESALPAQYKTENYTGADISGGRRLGANMYIDAACSVLADVKKKLTGQTIVAIGINGENETEIFQRVGAEKVYAVSHFSDFIRDYLPREQTN